jgi:phosphatidylglycerol---prolipoprotein diacylglyceryl transferase
MWPVLLEIGPVRLHSYGALVALGFLLGYAVTVAVARRHGLEKDVILDLAWVVLLAGLAGARAAYVLFNWTYFQQRPLEILALWHGGLVFYGGLAGALAAGWLWLRRQRIRPGLVMDVAAPGIALGHAIGRLGCFLAGCCYGRPTSRVWAVIFRHPDTLAPRHIPLHPSQLYEAALNFFLFVVLAVAIRRHPDVVGTGRAAAGYVVGYALIRALVELTRGDDRGPVIATLTATQWVALFTALLAAAWFLLGPKIRKSPQSPAR